MSVIAEELGLDRGTVSGDLKFLSKQEGSGVHISEIKFNAQLTQRGKWIKAIQSILDDALPY
jgi:hypothetical protein